MMVRAILLALAASLLPGAGPSYRLALPGYRYQFPRDHFEHPEFRTEWWYYTGNVRNEEGRRFGFELVFFRQAQRRGASDNPSAWRVDDMYLAHLALTDIDGKRFFSHRRLNRAGPGIAGASLEKRRIWNGNWSAQWQDDKQTLLAIAPEFQFELRLRPLKQPVIHGRNGVSQKAAGAGRASHYVSFTRLAVDGRISLDGKNHRATGTAWMDHEWFTHQLGDDQVGWDWFSIQFEDGSDLMLVQLRKKDGSVDSHSTGTYVDGKGATKHLTSSDFRLHPVSFWKSSKTGARYPVRWRISAPALGIELEATAALDHQELAHGDTNYWEGSVIYNGTRKGAGYMEMTGYDKALRLD
ncbi:MAG: lipocalin-like domain-containing protein [Bryobacteraceae bacterium]